ncbi:glycosyltransferase family 2 protein [Desulfonatronum parangueonense]
MTSLHLSIIIPVFNQWPLTEQCLHSLREHTPGRFFEVIVVDNSSTDETTTHCKALGSSLFPGRFHYLPQPGNLGFGRACNTGADQATGDFLFFLNNDTILTPNWYAPLLQAFQDDHRLGIAGPLLVYPGTERVQHMGIVFLPGNQQEHLYEFFPADHPLVTRKRHFQAITGAAMLMHRYLFHQCEGFFPGFVNGGEDVDLCARFARKGKYLTCIPESVVYHLASQTEGRFTHDIGNARLLHARCAGLLSPDIHRIIAEDAYELRLTPWLTPYVALPNVRRNRINAEVSSFQDIGLIRENLHNEPLWEEGYALLANHLEQSCAWEEACLVRFFHVHFAPSLDSMRQLFLTSKKAHQPQLMTETSDKMRTIEIRMNDMTSLRAKASGIYAKARKDGDADLISLYRNWLTANNPP